MEDMDKILIGRVAGGTYNNFNGSTTEPIPDAVRTVMDSITSVWSTRNLSDSTSNADSALKTHVACVKNSACASRSQT